MRPNIPLLVAELSLIFCAMLYFSWPEFDGAPRLPENWATERERLLKEGGGNAESEKAVNRGLAWLALQQKEDGSWAFDGSSKDQVAATGLALLPFLASGEFDHFTASGRIHKGQYQKTVAAGLDWLTKKMNREDGGFSGTNSMYSHAIATIALCEAAGRSKKPDLKTKAKVAIEFLLKAQGRNGSWGYTGPASSEGDTSIVGWQIQALAAADWAGIKIENKDKVYERADKFLEGVSKDNGAKYGYREPGESQTLTPVGLLSRHSMGKMSPKHPAFGRGADFVKKSPPKETNYDTYYYYYASRVMILRGGDDWHKEWNPKMRDLLIGLQDKSDDKAVLGSWYKDEGFIGSACGRLGTTALAILTLEIYYRNPPRATAEIRSKEQDR